MSDKTQTSWSLVEIVTKVVPVLALVLGAIFWVADLDNRVSGIASSLADMQSTHIERRVQTLEDDRTNDAANVTSEVQSLQTQVQSVQAEEHDLNNALAGVTQQLATIQAQMAFLINQNWPNSKVGK